MSSCYMPIWSLGMRAISVHDCGKTTRQCVRHVTDLLALPEQEQNELSVAKLYAYTMQSPAPSSQKDACRTILCSCDLSTFGVADALASKGYHPVVLNMANAHHCGGVWCQARGSQEEGIFQCSTLPLSLWPRRAQGDERFPFYSTRKDAFFPLSQTGVIYTPKCRMTRGEGFSMFAHEPATCEVAVISAAAEDLRLCMGIKGPECSRRAMNTDLMKETIRSIFQVAEAHGHDAVVLGAFGCGAFGLNPHVVAQCFAEVLEEFQGFRVVCFGIVFSKPLLDAFGQRFLVVNGDTPHERYANLQKHVDA